MTKQEIIDNVGKVILLDGVVGTIYKEGDYLFFDNPNVPLKANAYFGHITDVSQDAVDTIKKAKLVTI